MPDKVQVWAGLWVIPRHSSHRYGVFWKWAGRRYHMGTAKSSVPCGAFLQTLRRDLYLPQENLLRNNNLKPALIRWPLPLIHLVTKWRWQHRNSANYVNQRFNFERWLLSHSKLDHSVMVERQKVQVEDWNLTEREGHSTGQTFYCWMYPHESRILYGNDHGGPADIWCPCQPSKTVLFLFGFLQSLPEEKWIGGCVCQWPPDSGQENNCLQAIF